MHSNKPALSFRVRTLNFFRRIFILPFFENILVGLISKNPRNGLLRKIQPNNYLYPAPSIRKANRWGINFELDISDYQEWLIYFASEQDSSFDLLNYLSKGDHVLDIGGNIGQTGLRMAEKVGPTGSVVSFEPYPPTFQKYEKNLSLNKIYQPLIRIENIGLGTTETTVKMFQPCATNSGSYRMLHNDADNPEGLIDVEITTLDKYVQKHSIAKVDFIKIDVEGFEFNVLRGAENTLLKFKPCMYIEIDDGNLKDQGSSGKEVIEWLGKKGYLITRADTKEPISVSKYPADPHYDIYCKPALTLAPA
jgi:FkbM family methyltransferase